MPDNGSLWAMKLLRRRALHHATNTGMPVKISNEIVIRLTIGKPSDFDFLYSKLIKSWGQTKKTSAQLPIIFVWFKEINGLLRGYLQFFKEQD
ncbi:MAG: hypothetical protein UY35_C0036G0004 [Candidatus Saccharibacteria bacterium GW2011_GWC2_48_9]|nr:MAG: hypothetical protein UY35_C0036G0004 [Candidatus Saccharibacteria bacterium GW2011_GWC2_48_9]